MKIDIIFRNEKYPDRNEYIKDLCDLMNLDNSFYKISNISVIYNFYEDHNIYGSLNEFINKKFFDKIDLDLICTYITHHEIQIMIFIYKECDSDTMILYPETLNKLYKLNAQISFQNY